jgi:hypothetical protein
MGIALMPEQHQQRDLPQRLHCSSPNGITMWTSCDLDSPISSNARLKRMSAELLPSMRIRCSSTPLTLVENTNASSRR